MVAGVLISPDDMRKLQADHRRLANQVRNLASAVEFGAPTGTDREAVAVVQAKADISGVRRAGSSSPGELAGLEVGLDVGTDGIQWEVFRGDCDVMRIANEASLRGLEQRSWDLTEARDAPLVNIGQQRIRAGDILPAYRDSQTGYWIGQRIDHDLFVALTPSGGIPARVGATPGWAICQVYQLQAGLLTAAVPVHARLVRNLSTTAIGGGEYIPIAREAWSDEFIALQPGAGSGATVKQRNWHLRKSANLTSDHNARTDFTWRKPDGTPTDLALQWNGTAKQIEPTANGVKLMLVLTVVATAGGNAAPSGEYLEVQIEAQHFDNSAAATFQRGRARAMLYFHGSSFTVYGSGADVEFVELDLNDHLYVNTRITNQFGTATAATIDTNLTVHAVES